MEGPLAWSLPLDQFSKGRADGMLGALVCVLQGTYCAADSAAKLTEI